MTRIVLIASVRTYFVLHQEIVTLIFILSRIRTLHKKIIHSILQLLVQIRSEKKRMYWSNAIRGWRTMNRCP